MAELIIPSAQRRRGGRVNAAANAAMVVEIRDQRLNVKPAMPTWLRQLDRPPMTPVAENGFIRLERRSRMAFSSNAPAPLRNLTAAYPDAGLQEVVVHKLRQDGHRVSMVVPPPLPEVFVSRWNEATLDRNFLTAVEKRPHTLVRVARTVDCNQLIAQCAMAWPHLRLAIAAPTHQSAIELSTYLDKLRIPNARARRGHDIEDRIVVGTFTSLADCECEKRDILIALDARNALSELAAACLLQVDSRWRLVGFLPSDATLSPHEYARVTATFGVVAVDIWQLGLETTLPQVVSLVHHHRSASNLNAANLLRSVRRNPIRNRRICRLVKSIVSADFAAITKEWGASNLGELLGGRAPAMTILATADSDQSSRMLEHHKSGEPFSPTSDDGSQTANGRASYGVNVVATPARIADTDLVPQNGMHVVVWAGAGAHAPRIPVSWMKRPYDSTGQVLIVDIEDLGSGDLVGMTQQRRRAYRKTEWIAPGEDLVAHRAARYLQEHVRGEQE